MKNGNEEELKFKVASILILILMLVAVLLASCPKANAIEIEAGIGKTNYGMADGIWWDSRFNHSLEQEKFALSLGLTGKFTDSLSWRTGYLDLGDLKMKAIGLSDDSTFGRTCTSTFISSMKVKGFYAGLRKGMGIGKATLFGEAGLFTYRSAFQVVMEDMPHGYNPDNSPYGLETVVKSHDAKWVANPYIGGGVSYKDVSFSINYYKLDDNRTNDGYQPAYTGAVVGMVGMRF